MSIALQVTMMDAAGAWRRATTAMRAAAVEPDPTRRKVLVEIADVLVRWAEASDIEADNAFWASMPQPDGTE